MEIFVSIVTVVIVLGYCYKYTSKRFEETPPHPIEKIDVEDDSIEERKRLLTVFPINEDLLNEGERLRKAYPESYHSMSDLAADIYFGDSPSYTTKRNVAFLIGKYDDDLIDSLIVMMVLQVNERARKPKFPNFISQKGSLLVQLEQRIAQINERLKES